MLGERTDIPTTLKKVFINFFDQVHLCVPSIQFQLFLLVIAYPVYSCVKILHCHSFYRLFDDADHPQAGCFMFGAAWTCVELMLMEFIDFVFGQFKVSCSFKCATCRMEFTISSDTNG